MANQMPAEDKEADESEEEQQREQRLIPRTYNPNRETHYHQQQDEYTNTDSQSDFLTWNPGNKFMVLQINDFIGVKQEDNSESEENERVEEPAPVKPRNNWGYQGAYDFEDHRRTPAQKMKEEPKSSRLSTSSKRRKKNFKYDSAEDTESDVYGADPVVHYLRNKNKRNETQFDFGEIPEDIEDEFNFRQWWKF